MGWTHQSWYCNNFKILRQSNFAATFKGICSTLKYEQCLPHAVKMKFWHNIYRYIWQATNSVRMSRQLSHVPSSATHCFCLTIHVASTDKPTLSPPQQHILWCQGSSVGLSRVDASFSVDSQGFHDFSNILNFSTYPLFLMTRSVQSFARMHCTVYSGNGVR